MQAFAHAQDLQGRTNRVGIMLSYAGDQGIGVAHVDHHRSEDVAVVEQSLGFAEGDAAALPQAEQFLGVALAMVRGCGIDNLHAFQIHAKFAGASLNSWRSAEQDGIADLFFDQRVAGAQDLFVVPLREHDLFGIGLGLVNHGARNFVGLAESALQLRAIGFEIDWLLRYSAAHGSFGDGRGLPHQHAGIEGLGNEILAAKLQARDAIGAAHGVGNIFFGEIGQRVRGGELHLFVDGGGAHVERAAEDERKAEHVVDLVGIVGASGGDDDVAARAFRFFVGNFGIGIRHGKYDRVGRHGAHHLGVNCPFHRESGEHIGADHGFRQRAQFGFLGETLFVLVHPSSSPQ